MKHIYALIAAFGVISVTACMTYQNMDTRAESFFKADLNADSLLTYGEYQAYISNQASLGNVAAQSLNSDSTPERDKKILLNFQEHDLNKDTYVSRGELEI